MERLAVLGIDAAWSLWHASGVALVAQASRGWECAAVAPSYDSFIARAQGAAVDWAAPARGSLPDPARLLSGAGTLLGAPFRGVIAVDMPLASVPITRRRVADNALSSAFGARGCAVHSPTPERSGEIARTLHDGFAALGFPLATDGAAHGNCLIEVYPHVAVMALLGERYRVPYKLGRMRQYWPEVPPEQRRRNLLANWERISSALQTRIAGVPAPPAQISKRYEDALDALVCAWVGMQFLAGCARPYGDETAAIWVPAV